MVFDRASAIKREKQLKGWARVKKLVKISGVGEE